ncbi:hypothetical protein QYE76_047746 [Lolium multiflorum]|uniref:CCHC-type domain-containing protein n=1 Tax=Lolium multiflorum TaxID=4521 RepID=A0AAD8X291_LOLMU|nr:hypothetical protein QYE76_047746 [Lolium multiflorum]
MDNLSAESKSLYEILKAESREEYEARFLAHKKEILDAMRDYVTDTTKQIQEINTAVDSVRIGMGKELTEAREALGTELEAVKAQISADIAHLASAVDRVARPSPNPAAGGSGGNGPVGHGSDSPNPGKGCATHTSPPGGGMNSDSKTSSQFFPSGSGSQDADASTSAPRVELPHFEGTNPKLWQRRSEEYFQRWNTPRILWVSYSTSQFTGAAATWLESFLERNPCAEWQELVDGVMARFMRNQQQVFTCISTNHVEEIKELEAQVLSLKKDLEKRHEGKSALDKMLSVQQSPNDKSGLGFNSNNKKKSKSKSNKKKGQDKVNDPAKLVCFKCKVEGHHVRSCPLKKKKHLSEKQQGKRPQGQGQAHARPQVEDRPLPKKNQDIVPQEKKSIKKRKGNTCYLCREKGHFASSCLGGTLSNPIIVDDDYSLGKDKNGNVFAKFVGTQSGFKKRTIWVAKPIVTNLLGPNLVGDQQAQI